MDLTGYLKNKGRSLPVFLLVDASGSMSGSKIETVNIALKEMLNSFKKIENPKGIIEVCILAFYGKEVHIIKPLSEISDNDYFVFSANGGTPMGKAFATVADLIEDYNVVDKRSYTPTVVLISDGNPTDFNGYFSGMNNEDIINWPDLQKLLTGNRSSKATRLAMGIGEDVDNRILKAFINNDNIPIIKAKENQTISKFFDWVTISISIRSVSVNPNVVQLGDTDCFNEDEMEF